MDWMEFVKTMFSLGNVVTGYVNVVITPEQYKQITGKDYVAPATVAQDSKLDSWIQLTHSRRRNTQYINKPRCQYNGAFVMGGYKKKKR